MMDNRRIEDAAEKLNGTVWEISGRQHACQGLGKGRAVGRREALVSQRCTKMADRRLASFDH